MKIRKNSILIIYLFFLLSFFISIFTYIPIPKVNNLSINNSKNKIFISKILISEKNLNNHAARKMNIGEGYEVFIDEDISFQIISIAFAMKNKFDLSKYAKYYPELIIEADDINFINGNSIGLKRSTRSNKYQTCLLLNKYPSFIYQTDNVEIIYKYSDYNYWLNIFKDKVFSLLKKNNFNCLLITTKDPEIFEDNSMYLYKIIKNNFIYEGN